MHKTKADENSLSLTANGRKILHMHKRLKPGILSAVHERQAIAEPLLLLIAW